MTHVFLIHGVGLPSKDKFGSKLTQKLHKRGITNHKIIPVDWHKLVLLPYIDLETVKKPFRILNLNQISGLMRGLAGAAVLPGPRDFRVCRFAYAVLHCAMIPAPFIMLWSVTLLAGQISSSTNGVGQSLLRPIVQLNALLFEPALDRLSGSRVPIGSLYWSWF